MTVEYTLTHTHTPGDIPDEKFTFQVRGKRAPYTWVSGLFMSSEPLFDGVGGWCPQSTTVNIEFFRLDSGGPRPPHLVMTHPFNLIDGDAILTPQKVNLIEWGH